MPRWRDDKILHGNSLLGLTDLRQLEGLHITPPSRPLQTQIEFRGNELVERLDIDHRIQRAIALRRQLATEIDEHDPQRTAAAKRAQMKQLKQVTEELRLVADGIIAAGLPLGGKPGKKLDEAYENLRIAVGKSLPLDPEAAEKTPLGAIIRHGLTPTVETDYDRWQPLHWCLEVPDVFGRGGFDAVIGNPPFLGRSKLSGAVSPEVRDWLVQRVSKGQSGAADLVAYFILRAYSLLTSRGSLGLIGTNTIAQGDTREIALDRLLQEGFEIMRSIQSNPWPSSTASLEYSAVWGTRGPVAATALRLADEILAPTISSLLEPEGRVSGHPRRLTQNRGEAFLGCYVHGEGFHIPPAVADAWIAADPRNEEVLFPFMNGSDINSRFDGSAVRWVIDFGERNREEAGLPATVDPETMPQGGATETVSAHQVSPKDVLSLVLRSMEEQGFTHPRVHTAEDSTWHFPTA